jgi:hypothetical protein
MDVNKKEELKDRNFKNLTNQTQNLMIDNNTINLYANRSLFSYTTLIIFTVRV